MTQPIEIVTTATAQQKLSSYPQPARGKLTTLRQLIIDGAEQIDGVTAVQETLKWGQLSYAVKGGSPIRLDLHDEGETAALYFHCQTQLVETFRELYGDQLDLDGKRAILLTVSDPIPTAEVAHCLQLALTYHKVKMLPLLVE